MASPAVLARRVARLALFACLALVLGGAAKAKHRYPRPKLHPLQPVAVDDGLPPLDVLPPESATPAPPVPPVPVAAVPPARPPVPVLPEPEHRWRFSGAAGLEFAGAGFQLTGGGLLAAERRLYEAAPLAFDAGLRASYAPRIREVFVDSGGRSLPAAVFYAQTGDVSAIATTSFAPFQTVPLELAVEAGAGLAWRSGHQKLIDRQVDASGVGLATHVAVSCGWRFTRQVVAGVRLEAQSAPQPVRLDVPAMPTDLGAVRAMLTLQLAP